MAIYLKRPLIYLPRKKKTAEQPAPTPPTPHPESLEAMKWNINQFQGQGGSSINPLFWVSYNPYVPASTQAWKVYGKNVFTFRSGAYAIVGTVVRKDVSFANAVNKLRWIGFGSTWGTPYVYAWCSSTTDANIYRIKDSSHSSPYSHPISIVSYTLHDNADPNGYDWNINKLSGLDNIFQKLDNKLSSNLEMLLILDKVPQASPVNEMIKIVDEGIAGHQYWGQHTAVVDFDIGI